MFKLAALFGLLGLATITGIIVWSGYGQVMAALDQAGWGILWTNLYHLIPMLCCVIGWRALMPGKKRPSHLFFLYVLWLRSSVNNLMPVARIGGEVLAVRVMMKHGIRKTSAVASTAVELTTSVLAVFLFDVIGIALFTHHVADRAVGWQLAMGLLLSLPAIVAMIIVQRVGFFGLLDKIFALMLRDKWKNLMGNMAKLDQAVHVLYRRWDRVLICTIWQFLGWLAGTAEVWLALYYLGHPLSLINCLMIEALIQAAASAAFVVPGALGVQEAGFVFFGHMLGLTPDIAVALAVIRRCRDLLLYVPGLIVWQVQEGRWLLRSRKIESLPTLPPLS